MRAYSSAGYPDVSDETPIPSLGPRLRPNGAAVALTARELDVLTLMARGSTNRQIAAALFISVNTVRNHVQHTITKLGAHSKLEAVAVGVREGIVEMEKRADA